MPSAGPECTVESVPVQPVEEGCMSLTSLLYIREGTSHLWNTLFAFYIYSINILAENTNCIRNFSTR